MTSTLVRPGIGPACHRAIMAVDVEGSTARTNPAKARIRKVMYEFFEQALRVGGITERHRDPLVDCGDGALALIHPVDQAPKALLLSQVVPTLRKLLDDHEAMMPDEQFRLRTVVHAGEVHYDRHGCFGEALDITFRLLNTPQIKGRLRNSISPLILVVSDDIYRSVVRHGYDGIDADGFEPLVHVWIAAQQHSGWIQLPTGTNSRRFVPAPRRNKEVGRTSSVQISDITTKLPDRPRSARRVLRADPERLSQSVPADRSYQRTDGESLGHGTNYGA